MESEIKAAIRIHGADAVFTAASAGECEDVEPLRAMGLEVYDTSDADYIRSVVYNSMTPEEQEVLYQEALADDPISGTSIHDWIQ